MATQVQFRRGTTAQTSLFTGAAGEIVVDSTLHTISVQDGVTQGGTYLARQIDLTTGLSNAASNTANVSLVTTAAFNKANAANSLAQSAFDSANTTFSEIEQDFIEISGIDDTQNNNIILASNLAQAAYNTANSALASSNSSSISANISYIMGVDISQNTSISSTLILAQAAFDRANTIPSANSTVAGGSF